MPTDYKAQLDELEKYFFDDGESLYSNCMAPEDSAALVEYVSIVHELLTERNELAKELFDTHQWVRKRNSETPCFCDRCQAYQAGRGYVAHPAGDGAVPTSWELVAPTTLLVDETDTVWP